MCLLLDSAAMEREPRFVEIHHNHEEDRRLRHPRLSAGDRGETGAARRVADDDNGGLLAVDGGWPAPRGLDHSVEDWIVDHLIGESPLASMCVEDVQQVGAHARTKARAAEVVEPQPPLWDRRNG
jgi:hypothetical protein